MLLQLDINNIALIDKISLELGSGLNIVTGETGAGKSIIIDSINAVLGGRVSKDIIRTGKDKASVEAVFKIDEKKFKDIFEENGIETEEDETLIISREFNVSGKNICRINGKLVTVSVLKKVGELLIDIHSQFENQSLLNVESHVDFLDSFAGDKLQTLIKNYKTILDEYRSVKSKLKSLSGDSNDRERKIDILKYQIDEIKSAKLKEDEEEELNKKKFIYSNSEKILNSLSKVYDSISAGSLGNSAIDCINGAVYELSNISKIDEKYSNLFEKLNDLSLQLDDVINDVRNERDALEFDPKLIEEVDERLDLIFRLKRKYGKNIGEILEYNREIEVELDDILNNEQFVNNYREKLISLDGELLEFARLINKERVKTCSSLEISIENELNELEMKNAKFKVSINHKPDLNVSNERDYKNNGLDSVEFLISPNAGEPLKPLSKIASGGEMSRIMLAIKTILANVDMIPTLIFDEIDIGVSGKTAQKLGEKLSYISKNHQVICVTHLAQIACMADQHYLIEKVTENAFTSTKVKKLDTESIVKEIARILGGANITEITLKHAEEMIKNSRI